MLSKIISNGQVGAGQTALELARKFRIETGGIAAHNWSTIQGSRQQYLESFGLVANSYNNDKHPCYAAYQANVKHSQGVVWFGTVDNMQYNLVISEARDCKIPVIVNPGSNKLLEFLNTRNVSTLYVTGNNPTEFEGIDDFVNTILSEVFLKIKE